MASWHYICIAKMYMIVRRKVRISIMFLLSKQHNSDRRTRSPSRYLIVLLLMMILLYDRLMFHFLMKQSYPAESRESPSSQSKHVTPPWWASAMVWRLLPGPWDGQMMIVLSSEPLARRSPEGDHAKASTWIDSYVYINVCVCFGPAWTGRIDWHKQSPPPSLLL